MATSVSPLVNDLEVDRGDRPAQKPVVIDLYNRSMGGVDRAHQSARVLFRRTFLL